MSMKRLASSCALIAIVALPAHLANAQPQPAPAPVPATSPPPPPMSPLTPPPAEHSVVVTISPAHLALPVLELAAELKLAPNMSVVVLAGAGTIDVDGLVEDVTVFEVGGHFRYYALGDFEHGMQVGAEVIYIDVRAEQGGQTALVNGVVLGPFIGYKFTAQVGFTVDIQGGVEFVALRGESSSGSTSEDDDVIPLVNINVGWAF